MQKTHVGSHQGVSRPTWQTIARRAYVTYGAVPENTVEVSCQMYQPV